MNNELIKYINDMAEEMIFKFDISVPIVDIDKEIRKMGGTIEEIPGTLKLDSTLRKTGDNSFAIKIPAGLKEMDKKYLISRHLGHLFLNMGFVIKPDIWNSQKIDVPYERPGAIDAELRAKEFAKAFLLPYHAFVHSLNNHVDDRDQINMKEVAEEFHISMSFAVVRGKDIGYIL